MYVQGRGHEHLGPGTAMVQFAERGAFPGLGGCRCPNGMGCGPGCGCASCQGMGLFESGLDPSGWTWMEWAIVIGGGYMVLSTIFTTKRAASRIAALPGERRKRKAARYRKLASELTAKKK